MIGTIFIYVMIFEFLNKITILIHEVGHVIAGSVFGFIVHRVYIGTGFEVFRLYYKGVSFIFCSKINSGFTYASCKSASRYKLRKVFLVMGGILLNLIIILVIYPLTNFRTFSLTTINLNAILIVFQLTNILSFIVCFLPMKRKINFFSISNDALKFLEIIFMHKHKFDDEKKVARYFSFLDAYEKQDFDIAEKILDEIIMKSDELYYRLLKMNFYIYRKEYGKVMSFISEVENINHLKDDFLQQIICNLKNFLGIFHKEYFDNENMKNLELCISYQKDDVMIKALSGTKGSLMILNGSVDDGIDILKETIKRGSYNNGDAIHSYILSYGYLIKNNRKSFNKYYDFALKYRKNEEIDKNAFNYVNDEIERYLKEKNIDIEFKRI
jgi:hypothetical protein